MNALWWLYAVLLGAALANIVMSLTLQVKSRLVARIPVHLPSLLWGIVIALLASQVWVASVYEQESTTEVTVLELAAFLWVPLSTLVMSVLLGEQWWESRAAGDPMTAREQFPRIIGAVLWVFVVLIVVNLVHQAFSGSLQADLDRLFQVLLGLVAVAGLLSRRLRESAWLAVMAVAVLTAYLVMVYGTVGTSPLGI